MLLSFPTFKSTTYTGIVQISTLHYCIRKKEMIIEILNDRALAMCSVIRPQGRPVLKKGTKQRYSIVKITKYLILYHEVIWAFQFIRGHHLSEKVSSLMLAANSASVTF